MRTNTISLLGLALLASFVCLGLTCSSVAATQFEVDPDAEEGTLIDESFLATFKPPKRETASSKRWGNDNSEAELGGLYVGSGGGLVPVIDATSYSDEDLAGQMSQIDISALLIEGTMDLNETLVIDLLEKRRIGSVLNSPSAHGLWVPSVEKWREISQRLYDLSTQYGSKIPIIFGLDTVHGANYVFNATLFPQQIGVGATFNTTVASDTGRIGGMETRYAGVPWAFSPILGIAVQPSWARVFETFGEDPHLATVMGIDLIQGLQSKPPKEMNLGNLQYLVAACMKHYIGYPNVRTGHDRTPVFLPMNILMQYFAPSFEAAIKEAGVLSAMENYIELNGKPVVASKLLLKTLLRETHQFQGMLVTDYNEIYNLHDFHQAAASYKDAVEMSLSATTIDMGMIGSLPNQTANPKFPYFADTIVELLKEGALDRARLEASVSRVLTLKQQLGLMDGSPVPNVTNGSCAFGCESHRHAALDAVRQSITLLNNTNDVLPLPTSATTSIAVVGEACNSVPLMAGGWSVHWQGTSNRSAYPYGSTVLEELRARYNNVSYAEGCSVLENAACSVKTLADIVNSVNNADYTVVCVGERHYAEKPGDIDDLILPGEQIKMVNELAKVSNKLIVVLVEGRPRILENIPDIADAVIHSYLPGPFGGQAITEVLTGEINPSGRLPITYPKTVNNAPIQYWRKYSANTGDDYVVQWEFGHGLSYSTVTSENMTAMFSTNTGSFDIVVDVQNVDGPAVDYSVLLYSTQKYRAIPSEVRQLRAFKKVHLEPNERQTVRMSVYFKDFSYVDEYNCPTLQRGNITFFVGDQSASAIPLLLRPTLRLGSCSSLEYVPNGTPSPPPAPPKATTPDYFISAIVCFGAGIIGTVFIVFWLKKKKGQSYTPAPMLEPNTV